MKRSQQVPASLIVSLAAGLVATGCGSTRTYRECVDQYGKPIPDTMCRNGSPGAHYMMRSVRTGGFGGGYGGYGGGGGGGFFGG